MQKINKFILLCAIALLLFTSVTTTPSSAQSPQPPDKPDDLALLEAYTQQTFPNTINADLPYSPNLYPSQLEKAEPDECYNGIGTIYTGTVSLGCTDSPYLDAQPKVNQAYVWGLTQSDNDLWFGTGPNTHCLVAGMYMGTTMDVETDSFVCEFGYSQYSPPIPEPLGDWRPPDGFRYDINTDMLYDVHPINYPSATIQDAQRFTNTLGIRSAGTYHGSITNTVFLAGPSLDLGGVNIFAYNADTSDFISSTTLISYTNIRKWLEINGELYTGVARQDGSGAVLKYTGDPTNPATIFDFEEVGLPYNNPNLPNGSDVAELAFHDGRLFVVTWPTFGSQGTPAILWMSPPIPPGGLTSAHLNAWRPVWNYGSYDPNPATAMSTGGGALISFGGYLYWGTMHVPMLAAAAQLQQVPPDPSWDDATTYSYIAASVMGNHRAFSIFRGRDFGSPFQNVELLYGETELPAYVENNWVVVPNNMGVAPLYGGSGFGNFYNNYTWTMSLLHNELYVGTMDWSYLVEDGLNEIFGPIFGLPPDVTLPLPNGDPGADLWRFRDVNLPAERLNYSGVGNDTNYGIRTMITSPDDRLFLGSANPMNLHPDGGWELIEMLESPPLPDLSVYMVDSHSPAPVPPGEVLTYTVNVTNYGYGEALNVRVFDTLPVGVTYNNGNPDCVESPPGELTCTLGDLGGYDGFIYDSVSTQISVTAPISPTYLYNEVRVYNDRPDDYYGNNDDYLITSVDYTTDFEISKTASLDSVFPGDLLTYTLTITNTGPDDFYSMTSFNLPTDDYIFIPSAGLGIPYPSDTIYLNELDGEVESVRVTLNGLTHTRTADLHVMLVSPDNTKVMLMAAAGGGLNFNSEMVLVFDDNAVNYIPFDFGITSGIWKPTNYSGLDLFPLPVPLGPINNNLSAFQGDNPNGYWELYVLDSTLLYSGQIEDGWTLDLTLKREVTVEDDLVEGLTLTNTVAPNWDCNDLLGVETCTRDTFTAGESSQIELMTEYGIIDAEFFTNSAEVTPQAYDPISANNIAAITVNIEEVFPDLAVTKTGPDQIVPGEEVEFTIEYSNTGLIPAANVVITDTLPLDLTTTQPLVWELGEVAVGETGTLTLTVIVAEDVPIGTWVTNNVEITTSTFEDDLTNNSDSFQTETVAPDLVVTKTGPDQVVPGEEVEFTITYTNAGSYPAADVIVTDTLPLELTSQPLVWNLGEVAVGETGTLTLTAVVTEEVAIGTWLTNNVKITTTTFEADLTNNSDSFQFEVVLAHYILYFPLINK